MYFIILLATLVGAQDCCGSQSSCCESKARIALPLKNVEAGCCTSAVADALKKRFGETASVPQPNEAVLKSGKALLSDIEAALKEANAGMGRQMKLTYALDESKIAVARSEALFEGARADLEKAFPGQTLVEREGGIVAVTFDSKSALTLAEIRKAGKLKDVELRAAPCCKCCCEK